jgi:NAD(P)-dependent dehydrogenase (short-subunit alcohol dehydrogenase family)
MSNIQSFDLKTWQKVINVNLTSSFILSKYLIPLIQKSLSPRIIFTTSGISKKAKAFWGPYAISKAGVNALADILIDELESVSNVKIFNFNPKATQTDMRATAYPAENPSNLKKPKDLMNYYTWMLSSESALYDGSYIEYDNEGYTK